MNRKLKTTVVFVCAVFIAFQAHAQLKDIGSLLSGSRTDGQIILQEYLKPYANAFGTNMNGGWYNTAKNHKLLGFDLTFSVSTTFIPKADKEFDASTLGLSGTAGPGMSPTIAGAKTAGQEISYTLAGRSLSYNLPEGTNWGVIPSPMIQLGVGLVKETDLVFRYVPGMNIGSFGKFSLWGIGAKHSIKQYIPGIKMAPFFHLSVFLGYTKMKTAADINISSEFYNEYMEPDPTTIPTDNFDNQELEMTINGFTGSVLASFDLPVVTFYGGLGFSNTSANIKLKGNYPVLDTEDFSRIESIPNPVNLKITNSSGMKPRINLGIKFKMAVITIHFDYTYAKYSVVTGGLGISFR